MDKILKQQVEEAKAEEERFDYDVVDDELMHNAKQRRKRQRNKEENEKDEMKDDDDDDFRTDLEKANQKYRVKRKKKHLYNDAGIKIEPFGLKEEMDTGQVDRSGGMILLNERVKDEEDDDPW